MPSALGIVRAERVGAEEVSRSGSDSLAKASATSLGPSTVTSRAPTAAASTSASALSPSGATTQSSSNRAAASFTSPCTVARQSDRRTAMRRAARDRSSCCVGGPQGEGEVGRAVAPQHEEVVHDLLGGAGRLLALGHDHFRGERQHAVVGRRPEGHRRRRHRGGGQRPAAHRATAVDEQAQRRARLDPAPHPQLVGIGRGAAGAGDGQRVDAGVDVEIAAVGPVRHPPHLAHAAAPGRAAAGQLHHQPAGQPPGQGPQPLVGGAGEVGQQRRAPRRGRPPWPRRRPPRRARRPRARCPRSARAGPAPGGRWCGDRPPGWPPRPPTLP